MFDVVIKFPGTMSLNDYQTKIDTLKGWGCDLELDPALTRPIVELAQERVSASVVGKTADPFIPIAETLSVAEKKLIDKALQRTHSSGTSPLLDNMNDDGAAGKPYLKDEIVKYFQFNPGHTRTQCADALSFKFAPFYSSRDEARHKVGYSITTLTYAKGHYRVLEARGGSKGRGGSANIYVIGEGNATDNRSAQV